jgi:hypothetical protein
LNWGTHRELVASIAFTTLCWIIAAFAGPQTNRQTLIDFYLRVHPFGPGWRRIRMEAGVSEEEIAEYARKDNIPLAMLGWVSGVSVIWSALFTVGNLLYGRTGYSLALLGIFVLSAYGLIFVIRRLWR